MCVSCLPAIRVFWRAFYSEDPPDECSPVALFLLVPYILLKQENCFLPVSSLFERMLLSKGEAAIRWQFSWDAVGINLLLWYPFFLCIADIRNFLSGTTSGNKRKTKITSALCKTLSLNARFDIVYFYFSWKEGWQIPRKFIPVSLAYIFGFSSSAVSLVTAMAKLTVSSLFL